MCRPASPSSAWSRLPPRCRSWAVTVAAGPTSRAMRCAGRTPPYASVTRGQLSKIVVGAAGWALQAPATGTFADVAPGSAFYPFVETAVCHTVVSGYACGGAGEPCDRGARPYFRQASPATRGQIAKIVYTSLTSPGACAAPIATRTSGPPTPTGVPPAPTVTRTAVAGAPLRAAFYYPWFPEAWTQQGIYPYTNYHPSAGYYNGSDPAVIAAADRRDAVRQHHGRHRLLVGPGHRPPTGAFPTLLDGRRGNRFRWTLYYENESHGDPTVSQIAERPGLHPGPLRRESGLPAYQRPPGHLRLRRRRRRLRHGDPLARRQYARLLHRAQGLHRLRGPAPTSRKPGTSTAPPSPPIASRATATPSAPASGR